MGSKIPLEVLKKKGEYCLYQITINHFWTIYYNFLGGIYKNKLG